MSNGKILWVDDEIDALKPHILFLNQKGYDIITTNNGHDAIERVQKELYDLIFLDENMPGIGGLETLQQLKQITPHTPVVMITKNEEEHIMEDAIGSKIADYLIKPVHPNQVLLTCKKLLEGKSLVSNKAHQEYLQDFRNIGAAIYEDTSFPNWVEVYKKLTYWDMELEKSEDTNLLEILNQQKAEANHYFCEYIIRNYVRWVNGSGGDRPLMSPDILPEKVFPLLQSEQPIFFILVDCMRFDQWKMFEKVLSEYFSIENEEIYLSILPSATQYARNAIFAGMFPLQISKKYPRLWFDDEEEEGKNLNEEFFLTELIVKHKLNIKFSYNKVISNEEGKELDERFNNLLSNKLNVVVLNFIDLLVHARTDVNIVKELAPDERALRSITRSWLEHSWFMSMMKKIKEAGGKVVLTTDHGMVKITRPLKIYGDRATSTNIRYKQGKNINYEKSKFIYSFQKPEEAMLPRPHVSSTYAFALQDAYLCYPTNYNYYANLYKDTFQHGGISMDELLIPIVTLNPKN